NGFQGLEGQKVPEMSDAYIETVSDRYIELYESIMGEPFQKADVADIQGRILNNLTNYLNSI
ncbi:MAG: phosphoribosylaminoimidazolesuccinocarboxamide synthase, partial [Croceitalea sp.]|nr:phosphoribosylaminoimidazolesuccinocarboxamide synthase [Croceitalea sp.]